jgi:hypothetical protein
MWGELSSLSPQDGLATSRFLTEKSAFLNAVETNTNH